MTTTVFKQLKDKTAQNAKPKEENGVLKERRYPDGGGGFIF